MLAARVFALEAGTGSACRVCAFPAVSLSVAMKDLPPLGPTTRGPNQLMTKKTRAALFCYTFRVLGIAQLFHPGSRTRSTSLRKITKLSAKVEASRHELFLHPQQFCQQFLFQYKDEGLHHAVDSNFCNTAATIRVRQSKSESARRVGPRIEPLWRLLDECLRTTFHDNADIVPSIELTQKRTALQTRRMELSPSVQVCPHWTCTPLCRCPKGGCPR